jgi:DNA-binding transcriptional LysR family regulator
MELRQIRYFIAVAERLSYSKAAQELHVSVSPLSRQIRQLEQEFDVRLFSRDRRRVELTDAGKMFLAEAKGLINHTAQVSDHLRLAKEGALGAVKVGIGLYLGDKLGSVVVEHSKRYPAVDIQCASIFSTLQNTALREGDIDIGFMRPPVDAVLASEVLYNERLIVVLGKTNPLAKRKVLRINDLAEETLFLPDRNVGCGLHDRTLELYAKAGISPKISPLVAEASSHGEVHKILLAANKGIFIVGDETSSRVDNGNVAVAVPLDEPDAKIEVRMAWRKNERSPAILAVIESARKVFGTSPESRAAHFAHQRTTDTSTPSNRQQV